MIVRIRSNWSNYAYAQTGIKLVSTRGTKVTKKQAIKNENSVTDKPETVNGGGLNEFVNETKQELGKVVWPSRQQLLSESAAVILMVILVATVIYFVDKIFGWIAGKVF